MTWCNLPMVLPKQKIIIQEVTKAAGAPLVKITMTTLRILTVWTEDRIIPLFRGPGIRGEILEGGGGGWIGAEGGMGAGGRRGRRLRVPVFSSSCCRAVAVQHPVWL